MKKIILSAALALTLSGCVTYTPPSPVMRPPFPEAEYAALNKTGSAVVAGQAFLKTRGGDVKTGAGNAVYIMPVTSYSTFAYDQRSADAPLSQPDPRMNAFTRETAADASGRFSFKNVPNGNYYIKTSVTWEVPTGGKYSYMSTQGGDLWKTVRVENDESVDVIITE